jgi:hypothetical protein
MNRPRCTSISRGLEQLQRRTTSWEVGWERAKLGLVREALLHQASGHRLSGRQPSQAQGEPAFGEEDTGFPSYAIGRGERESREERKS